MKFSWKFKKFIKEQIFTKLIKFEENLVKIGDNLVNLLNNEEN